MPTSAFWSTVLEQHACLGFRHFQVRFHAGDGNRMEIVSLDSMVSIRASIGKNIILAMVCRVDMNMKGFYTIMDASVLKLLVQRPGHLC